MDRHRTRNGLHRGVVTTQRAVPAFPSVLGVVGARQRSVASCHNDNPGPSLRPASGPFGAAGDSGPAPRDGICGRRGYPFDPPRSHPARHGEPGQRSITFSTLHGGRSQRPLSIRAFSLHRLGPDESASRMHGKPVRINDVRAQRKKRRQCVRPTHCCGYDLRFLFPHSGRNLHFLFQSARIGVGRSVMEG
jgi:hypothetical protein